MVVLWVVASLDDYMLAFYIKYIPGNIYVNTTVATVTIIVAYIASGFSMHQFGPKYSFIFSYLLAAGGGFLIALVPVNDGVTAIFVLLAQFGIAFAYNLCYLVTPTLFPTALCTSAFGFCNIFAMFLTIFAPMIAELAEPIPMLISAFSSVSAAFACLFLLTYDKSE